MTSELCNGISSPRPALDVALCGGRTAGVPARAGPGPSAGRHRGAAGWQRGRGAGVQRGRGATILCWAYCRAITCPFLTHSCPDRTRLQCTCGSSRRSPQSGRVEWDGGWDCTLLLLSHPSRRIPSGCNSADARPRLQQHPRTQCAAADHCHPAHGPLHHARPRPLHARANLCARGEGGG